MDQQGESLEALAALDRRLAELQRQDTRENRVAWEAARRERQALWDSARMPPPPQPDDAPPAQGNPPQPRHLTVTGPVTALSRDSVNMDVFAVGPDGGVFCAWWDGDPWRDWFRVGSAAFGPDTPVAALSRDTDFMDLFAVGPGGRVLTAWWNGNPWRDWYPVGTRSFAQNTPIATLSRNTDQMDLFAVGEDGYVYNAWWNGNPWSDWVPIGSRTFPQGTTIAAISRHSDQMDLFAVGDDGYVYNAWWNGDWHDWQQIGTLAFPRSTPVAAVSRNPGQMDLFAVGDDQLMYNAWWNGNPWHDWQPISRTRRFERGTPVAVLARPFEHMDVFAVGLDGHVHCAWWNGMPWREFYQVGDGVFAQKTRISAVTRSPGNMDLFANGTDGRVRTALWEGNPWVGWFPLPIVRPRPFYVIAHNPNYVERARWVLGRGANALGPDINVYRDNAIVDGSRLCVAHDPASTDRQSLAYYLDGIHGLAMEHPNLALVVFDIKPDACTPDFGLEILTQIRQRLTHDTGVNVILSVGKDEHAVAFDKIQGMLGPREGLMVDEENDPSAIAGMFTMRRVVNHGYGNGISVANGLIGPYKRISIEGACGLKAQDGVPKFVLSWTVDAPSEMSVYLDIGVDGLITDNIEGLVSVMGERASAGVVRMATRADNPMQPANHAYALMIHTEGTFMGGTDANVTFRLIGTNGMATKTVNTELIQRMEAGDWNMVTIPSEDLGSLKSIMVRRDDSGNGPDWHLDRIMVTSHRFGANRYADFKRWIDSTDSFSRPL